MSLDTQHPNEGSPLSTPSELVRYFEDAEGKDDKPLQLGLEHEKLLFDAHGVHIPAYEGERGVGAIFKGFRHFGFSDVRERLTSPAIAMRRKLETLSIEPGGQLELSGAPQLSARAVHAENLNHLQELKQVLSALGLRAVTLGYHPFALIRDMPWMPKTRYRIMRETLGKQGRLAHDMMLMTAASQVSLDWNSEVDVARKVTAAVKITPVLLAAFANSPLAHGQPTGYLSYRSFVWSQVDASRCGYPPCMLDGSFSYRAYVDWVVDAPMLFLRRNGEYMNPRCTFRQLLSKGWEGSPVTYSDWVDHLSTMFPEVRLKKVLEVRSPDAVNAALTGSLAALLRGLFYDNAALNDVLHLMPKHAPAQHLALHAAAQRQGLEASLPQGTLKDYAVELLDIAERGLKRLDPLDIPLLQPLAALLARGHAPAVDVLHAFEKTVDGAAFLKHFEI